ncbi:hypothetical protein SKAU_G00413350 [Synaphobranchus kaupii]|uniref:Uncharacterized protein n=1 Tax=Synaphobranchus kaupii TaxID=118154 RepID=A0A9Q1E864_SYNKA|nr:hypothetical protein SKAU_G00413350 [Synaphobranchus kaupii]
METPVILKIILTDGSSQRLTISHGLPASIDDLMAEVTKQCGLHGNFRLQFKDSLFGDEFLNLTSMSEVEDKGTLRIIDLSRLTTMQHDEISTDLNPILNTQAFSPSQNDSSSLSSGSVDTDVLSSCESTSSRSSWPAVFHVPKFSYDAELKLQQANLAYLQNGAVHFPDPKLKSSILDGSVQEIVQYKVYVTDKEMEQLAQSLIKMHPCLTEKGSCTGCGGWKTSLKYKLSNYRTQLRKLGCPEVRVNSLQNKPAGKRIASFGVKKAKRAEVNFCPTYPSAESEESLEAMQKSLLLDVKNRNNRDVVKLKMEKTFAHRRHEVVRNVPMVEDFMARWPALFEVSEINAEFKRITTVPLQSKFLSQLDLHTDKMTRLLQKRGGQLGERLKTITAQMADGMDENTITDAIADTTIGIYVLKEHASSDEPEDIGIVLEGIKVLQDLDNVALAVAMLFGLIYALNLSYPADLRYTFEVVQKIFMELDGGKLSNKALALKNRLYQ